MEIEREKEEIFSRRKNAIFPNKSMGMKKFQ